MSTVRTTREQPGTGGDPIKERTVKLSPHTVTEGDTDPRPVESRRNDTNETGVETFALEVIKTRTW